MKFPLLLCLQLALVMLARAQQPAQVCIENFVSDPCLQTSSAAVSVLDLGTGQFIGQHNPKLALPPASVLKVLTTAAAISSLGTNHRFETQLAYSGELTTDTLRGDLRIIGKGDPTLGSSYLDPDGLRQLLQRWAKLLTARGVRHIQGDVVGDASFYERWRLPGSWPFEDLGNYYGAVPLGLNVHDNLCHIYLQQHPALGGHVHVAAVEPAVPGLVLESYVRSAAANSGDQAYVMGAPHQLRRHIKGTIPRGGGRFHIKGSLPDPAMFIAHHLRSTLLQNGITVQGEARSNYQRTETELQWIDTVMSPSLAEIAVTTNRESVNLFAEAIGYFLRKDTESFLGMERFWQERGIDMTGARIVDFAGLAPDNAISTRATVEILQNIYDSRDLYAAILPTLAVAGQSGTLRGMLKSSPAWGSVYAKSGLINGVRNYAGYIMTEDGRVLAFAAFTFNPSCGRYVVRQKLEQLLESLYLSSE